MNLADIFVEDTIIPELAATRRSEVLQELVGVLQKTRRIQKVHAAEIQKAIERREQMGSTGIGRGVGVPHIKHPAVSRVVGAFGRSTKGIDFHALDGAPVYLVFLLLSPQDDAAKHLNALKKISALASSEDFRRFLRNAKTAKEIVELMKEADERISV